MLQGVSQRKGLLIGAFWLKVAVAVVAENLGRTFPSFAQPDPIRTDVWQKVSSPQRRVIVSGLFLPECADMAAAAEDALKRIEQLLGISLPFTRMDPIRIVLDRSPEVASGVVVRAEGWADRQLVQRLVVINPESVDQEDVLEDLARLACARLVIANQSAEQRETRLGRAPDWLAVGVAQNLYIGLRARNAEIMANEWEQRREFSLGEVLELDWMPAGRWGEKAAVGLAVELLAGRADRATLFRKLFRSVSDGVSINLAVLSAIDPLGRTPREWEKEWDIWISAQTRTVRLGQSEMVDRLKAVQNELDIKPLELGMPQQPDLPAALTPAELIERRYEAWAASLATLVAFRLRALGIGQPQTVWDVTHAYAEFFEAVAASRADGWFRRHWFKAVGTRTLQKKLVAAERKLQQRLAGSLQTDAGGSWLGSSRLEMTRFLPREERLRWADLMRAENARRSR